MDADIIRMAQEAGFETKRDMVFVDSWEITRSIERLVAFVRADEREACATRLEAIGCDHCAANIRARGHQPPAAIADRLARHGIPMPGDEK